MIREEWIIKMLWNDNYDNRKVMRIREHVHVQRLGKYVENEVLLHTWERKIFHLAIYGKMYINSNIKPSHC